MVEPDLLMVLETTTPMKGGSGGSGGSELFPGLVVQVSPQLGGFVLMVEANPLKLGGALPPLSTFRLDQTSLQNVSVLGPTTAVWSPSTNAPRERNAKTIVVAEAEDGR